MGRPRGKKSDPDYVQVTVYLRKDTHTTPGSSSLTSAGSSVTY
jgi:hypothetical protein